MSFRGSRAGKYRQVIQIEQAVRVNANAVGGVTHDWQSLHTNLRADINPGRGREFEIARQRNNELSHLISIRMIPGVDLEALNHARVIVGPAADIAPDYAGARIMRVIYAIIKDETNREIILACTEAQ